MRGELYEYNEQLMTQAQIAKLEDINRATLADWYKRTGDMKKAVEGAKKSLAQRNIPYYDEVLSLKAISEKEKIKFESLKKIYEQTGDIYEAVKLTKKAQQKRNGSILYNEKMMSMTAIAALNEIERHALTRYYEQTNDIDKSVEMAKKAKEKHHGTINYNGKIMSLTAIAALEKIKRETLKEYYDLYGDIEKAVFITKLSQLKRKQALLKGKQASYEELSRQFEISVIEIDEIVKSGKSLDSIEKKVKKGVSSENQLKYDDDSLYRFCLDHSYNYWVINYMIKTYGKKPEEAVKAYIENGQQIPTKWIYEKYDLLFKHLVLRYGLDSNRIIKIIKEDNCGIKEAIKKLVFRSNNVNNDFKSAEISWMEELYEFIENLSPEEYISIKDTFFITNREEEFLREKRLIIENIIRQLLLYELSEVIDIWSINELIEIMDLYEISNEERKVIVLDLYSPFKDMIIDPTLEYKSRNDMMKNIILDENIDIKSISLNSNLSDKDKSEIIRKRLILNQIKTLDQNTNNSVIK